MKRIVLSCVLAQLVVWASLVVAVEIDIAPANKTGVYKTGEEASWTVEVKGDDGPANGEATYVIKAGGMKKVADGKVELKDGKAVVKATKGEPGTLLLELKFGKKKALGGAVFDWEQIKPSAEEPADFDEFWQSKIKELKAVPMNVKLEKIEKDIPGNVDYWKITMDNIRGTKIYGQIAKPKDSKGKLPAFLQVQWAGVYPLQKGWVVNHAKHGWLAMNIIAHDIPIDNDAEFYKEQNKGPLSGYPTKGNDDRDTSYFLRMYLSCYRAVEYLSERPDWNGKTLFVTGGSQGGLQTMMIAGLNPKVTAASANVPAGCDHTGDLIGRSSGWPKWIRSLKGKDKSKVVEASKYYDVVNFARRVKCPVVVGVGLIDTTCPAAGVIAMFNQVPVEEKQLVILPVAGHMNKKGSHTPYYQTFGKFMRAAAKGGPVDPRK